MKKCYAFAASVAFVATLLGCAGSSSDGPSTDGTTDGTTSGLGTPVTFTSRGENVKVAFQDGDGNWTMVSPDPSKPKLFRARVKDAGGRYGFIEIQPAGSTWQEDVVQLTTADTVNAISFSYGEGPTPLRQFNLNVTGLSGTQTLQVASDAYSRTIYGNGIQKMKANGNTSDLLFFLAPTIGGTPTKYILKKAVATDAGSTFPIDVSDFKDLQQYTTSGVATSYAALKSFALYGESLYGSRVGDDFTFKAPPADDMGNFWFRFSFFQRRSDGTDSVIFDTANPNVTGPPTFPQPIQAQDTMYLAATDQYKFRFTRLAGASAYVLGATSGSSAFQRRISLSAAWLGSGGDVEYTSPNLKSIAGLESYVTDKLPNSSVSARFSGAGFIEAAIVNSSSNSVNIAQVPGFDTGTVAAESIARKSVL